MSQNSPETDDADTPHPSYVFWAGETNCVFQWDDFSISFEICAPNLQSSHFSYAYNYLLVLLLERKIMARKGLWGQKRADLFYLSMHSCECNDDKMEC